MSNVWPHPFRPTTLIVSERLSRRLGAGVLLASETFQHTGSFKFRAAFHVATQVPHPRIITASSGNFGQAMAFACRLLRKSCLVVMPHNSVQVKVDAVRAFGGEVDFIDVRQQSRAARVAELARAHPEAYVASAYDDPLVIAGNASLGRELAALSPPPDVILAPLGGGGLTSGIITGLRAAGSNVPVHAVEPLLANDGARSWRAGKVIANEAEPQTIADGARTISLGQHNWRVLEHGLDRVVEVSEKHIRESVRLLFLLANLKAEPTGALSIAALLAEPERFKGRAVCCVISGGNVDPKLFCKLIAEA